MPGVLILGATSAMARATAAAFARRGHDIYLAGRDREELRRSALDLAIRYRVKVEHGPFDATDFDSHGPFLRQVTEQMGGLDGLLLAFGVMGDMQAARQFGRGRKIIDGNFTGAASILSLAADYFEQRRSGFIAGITSVAGDRGRQSNYVYGAAKGALSLYLQGLRNRLFPAGVRVLTVKPGFVDTAMTWGLPGLFLVASPAYIGERIVRALEAGKDEIYLPWFWRWIMLIIKSIPEPVFKRLKL